MDTYRGKTVLIIGGCSERGSKLIHELVAEHGEKINIINFDNLSTGRLENLSDVSPFVIGYYEMDVIDRADIAHVIDQEEPDVILDLLCLPEGINNITAVLAGNTRTQYYQLPDPTGDYE